MCQGVIGTLESEIGRIKMRALTSKQKTNDTITPDYFNIKKNQSFKR